MKTLALGCLILLSVGCVHAKPSQFTDLCQVEGKKRSAVFENVSNGSINALDKTVNSLHCLDGGDLEDAHVAIGIGLFRYVSRFSSHIGGATLSKNDVQAVSVMLPSDFVDEPCKSVKELVRRKTLAKKFRLFGNMRPFAFEAFDEAIKSDGKQCSVNVP